MSFPPLLERYAERLRLSPQEARRRLFYECIPGWKRGCVRFYRRLRPGLYRNDWRLVDEAGKATTYQAVLDAIDRWNHRCLALNSVARNRWLWRMSGRRLVVVAAELLAEATQRAVVPEASPVGMGLAKPEEAGAPAPKSTRLVSSEVTELVRAHG